MRLYLIVLISLIFKKGLAQDINQLYKHLIDSNIEQLVVNEPCHIDFDFLKKDTLISIEVYGEKNKINWDSLQVVFLNSYSDSMLLGSIENVKLISSDKVKAIRSINSTLVIPPNTSERRRRKLRKKFLKQRLESIRSYSCPLEIAKNYYIVCQSYTERFSYSYYSLYYWDETMNKWIEKLRFHHLKE